MRIDDLFPIMCWQRKVTGTGQDEWNDTARLPLAGSHLGDKEERGKVVLFRELLKMLDFDASRSNLKGGKAELRASPLPSFIRFVR